MVAEKVLLPTVCFFWPFILSGPTMVVPRSSPKRKLVSLPYSTAARKVGAFGDDKFEPETRF